LNTIAVIGAGTMGAGIAQLVATRGCKVHLIDVSEDVAQRGFEGIAKRLARSVEKGKRTEDERTAIIDRIHIKTVIEDLADVDLAVEAVVEDMGVKHKVFAALENATPTSAILATNTSSLPVSKIAEAVSDPSRVIGMHFFNPAPIMPLVEIIAGVRSAASNIDAAYAAAQAWGKIPVRAKDTPGFIVNRVARGYYLEALRLLGEGVAGVDEIDGVMRTHGGFRMGPFELMDLVGLDVNFAVSTSVWQQFGKPPRLAPHEIQRTLVDQGYLGRKTGRGFFVYDGAAPLPAYPVDRKSFDLSPLLKDAMLAFCTNAGITDINGTEQYILCRILAAIMNEAGSALSNGVASKNDIDIAMTKGTNYPKGPLAWSDEIGPRTVRGVLKTLNDSVDDDRYAASHYFAEAE
jgi:3-hydroxybutyryl-CoA dehydrogenase